MRLIILFASPALPAAGHGLGGDEARIAVASLQCLQRLAGTAVVASTVGVRGAGWECAHVNAHGQGSKCARGLALHVLAIVSRHPAVIAGGTAARARFKAGNILMPALDPTITNVHPCLQRHGSGIVAVSQIVGASGGAGRIFAALLSGHDHVAAEAARLLLRFFAPSAARAGAGPWPGGRMQATVRRGPAKRRVHGLRLTIPHRRGRGLPLPR